jgi:hypothetical protein
MSAQEIIAELPNLTTEERLAVKEKLEALQTARPLPKTGWGRVLLEIAGTADDLPSDMSLNHDHYLYGTPKRE